MEYISIREASQKVGLSDRQIRNLCNNGRITGAMKVDNFWVIPEDFRILNKNYEKDLQNKFQEDRQLYGLKFNYVIIHGTFGHPGENWFPWLAEEISKLDKSGKTKREDILIPHFPSSDCADYDSWKSVILGYIDSGIINKNTIFICHSLGPLFISRVLIEKQVKVKGMISVGAAANHLMGNESFDKVNSTFFVPSWEYLTNVKKYLDFNYCFYTDNDPHVPFHINKEYVDRAATKAFLIPNSGHFNSASGYTKFPQLLELIKKIEKEEVVKEDEIENVGNRDGNSWNKELSHKWTNMTWPNRPSVSELAIYSKILRKSQAKLPEKKKTLILGSNVEFRDWAFEENLDVSIMQNNDDYHLATYRELRHKEAPYKIIYKNWHNVNFDNAYDFIVGDQLISNLGSNNIEPFIANIAKSLNADGYFFSKTYYKPRNYKTKTVEEIFENYNAQKHLNPINCCLFDLTMLCLDKNKFVDFKKIDSIIKNSYNKNLIDLETYKTLSNIGYSSMNFKFYVPEKEKFEEIVSKYFIIEDIEYTYDVGSENFPIYILKKK